MGNAAQVSQATTRQNVRRSRFRSALATSNSKNEGGTKQQNKQRENQPR